MHVDSYAFGHITVGGESHAGDVIIFPDRVEGHWRRRQGHRLEPGDLTIALAWEPEAVIIGTGESGAMKVPVDTIAYLESKGIDVFVMKTAAAVEFFNSLPKCRRIVAALHLTC